MSLHTAKKVDELLRTADFRAEFFTRAREAVSGALQDLAKQHGCVISPDEAYVLSSVFSEQEDASWITTDAFASILERGGVQTSINGKASLFTASTPPCNPSTPGDEPYGPGTPECNPSTPGDEIYGPSTPPCNPSTPGD